MPCPSGLASGEQSPPVEPPTLHHTGLRQQTSTTPQEVRIGHTNSTANTLCGSPDALSRSLQEQSPIQQRLSYVAVLDEIETNIRSPGFAEDTEQQTKDLQQSVDIGRAVLSDLQTTQMQLDRHQATPFQNNGWLDEVNAQRHADLTQREVTLSRREVQIPDLTRFYKAKCGYLTEHTTLFEEYTAEKNALFNQSSSLIHTERHHRREAEVATLKAQLQQFESTPIDTQHLRDALKQSGESLGALRGELHNDFDTNPTLEAEVNRLREQCAGLASANAALQGTTQSIETDLNSATTSAAFYAKEVKNLAILLAERNADIERINAQNVALQAQLDSKDEHAEEEDSLAHMMQTLAESENSHNEKHLFFCKSLAKTLKSSRGLLIAEADSTLDTFFDCISADVEKMWNSVGEMLGPNVILSLEGSFDDVNERFVNLRTKIMILTEELKKSERALKVSATETQQILKGKKAAEATLIQNEEEIFHLKQTITSLERTAPHNAIEVDLKEHQIDDLRILSCAFSSLLGFALKGKSEKFEVLETRLATNTKTCEQIETHSVEVQRLLLGRASDNVERITREFEDAAEFRKEISALTNRILQLEGEAAASSSELAEATERLVVKEEEVNILCEELFEVKKARAVATVAATTTTTTEETNGANLDTSSQSVQFLQRTPKRALKYDSFMKASPTPLKHANHKGVQVGIEDLAHLCSVRGVEQLQGEILGLKETNAELRSLYNGSVSEMEEMEAVVRQLQARTELRGTEEQLSRKIEENIELQGQLKGVLEDKNGLLDRLEAVCTERDSFNTQNTQLAEEMVLHKASIRQQQQAVSTFELLLKEKNKDLIALQAKLDASSHTDYETLKAKLHSVVQNYEALQKEFLLATNKLEKRDVIYTTEHSEAIDVEIKGLFDTFMSVLNEKNDNEMTSTTTLESMQRFVAHVKTQDPSVSAHPQQLALQEDLQRVHTIQFELSQRRAIEGAFNDGVKAGLQKIASGEARAHLGCLEGVVRRDVVLVELQKRFVLFNSFHTSRRFIDKTQNTNSAMGTAILEQNYQREKLVLTERDARNRLVSIHSRRQHQSVVVKLRTDIDTLRMKSNTTQLESAEKESVISQQAKEVTKTAALLRRLESQHSSDAECLTRVESENAQLLLLLKEHTTTKQQLFSLSKKQAQLKLYYSAGCLSQSALFSHKELCAKENDRRLDLYKQFNEKRLQFLENASDCRSGSQIIEIRETEERLGLYNASLARTAEISKNQVQQLLEQKKQAEAEIDILARDTEQIQQGVSCFEGDEALQEKIRSILDNDLPAEIHSLADVFGAMKRRGDDDDHESSMDLEIDFVDEKISKISKRPRATTRPSTPPQQHPRHKLHTFVHTQRTVVHNLIAQYEKLQQTYMTTVAQYEGKVSHLLDENTAHITEAQQLSLASMMQEEGKLRAGIALAGVEQRMEVFSQFNDGVQGCLQENVARRGLLEVMAAEGKMRVDVEQQFVVSFTKAKADFNETLGCSKERANGVKKLEMCESAARLQIDLTACETTSDLAADFMGHMIFLTTKELVLQEEITARTDIVTGNEVFFNQKLIESGSERMKQTAELNLRELHLQQQQNFEKNAQIESLKTSLKAMQGSNQLMIENFEMQKSELVDRCSLLNDIRDEFEAECEQQAEAAARTKLDLLCSGYLTTSREIENAHLNALYEIAQYYTARIVQTAAVVRDFEVGYDAIESAETQARHDIAHDVAMQCVASEHAAQMHQIVADLNQKVADAEKAGLETAVQLSGQITDATQFIRYLEEEKVVQVQELTKHIDGLSEKFTGVRMERDMLSEMCSEENVDLKQMNSTLKSENVSLKSQIRRFHINVAELTRKHTDATQTLQRKETLTTQLNTNIKDLTSENITLQQKVSEMTLSNANLANEVTSTTTLAETNAASTVKEIARLETTLCTEKEAKSAMSGRLAEVESALRKAEKEIEVAEMAAAQHSNDSVDKVAQIAQLNALTKQQEKTLLHATAQLDDITEQQTASLQRLQEQEDEVFALQSQLTEATKETHEVRSTLREEKEAAVSLRQQIAQHELTIHATKKDATSSQDVITALQTQLRNANELSINLREVETQRQLLQEQLNQLHVVAADRSNETALLTEENANLKERVAVLATELRENTVDLLSKTEDSESLADTNVSLNAIIAEQNHAINTLRRISDEASKLKETLSDKSASIQILESDVTTRDDAISSLQEKLRAQMEAHSIEKQALKEKVATMKAERQTLTQEWEGDVASRDAQLEMLKSNLTVLTNEHTASTAKWKNIAQDKNDSILQLGADLGARDVEIVSLKETISHIKSDHAALKFDSDDALTAALDDASTLNTQIQGMTEEIASTNAKIAALTTQTIDLQKTNTALKDTVATHNATIFSLNEEISLMQCEASSLAAEWKTDLEAGQAEVTKLRSVNAQLTTGHSATMAKWKSTLDDKNTVVQMLQTDLAERDTEIVALKEGVAAGSLAFETLSRKMGSDEERFLQEIQHLNDEHDALIIAETTLLQEKAETTQLVQTLRDDITTLHTEVASCNSKLAAHELDAATQGSTMQACNASLTHALAKGKEFSEEIEVLKEQICTLEETLSQANCDVDSAERHSAKQAEKVDHLECKLIAIQKAANTEKMQADLCKNDLDLLQTRHSEALQMIERGEDNVSKMSTSLAEVTQRLQEENTKYVTLQTAHEEASHQNQTLSDSLHSATEEIHSLRHTLTELEDTMTQERHDFASLKNTMQAQLDTVRNDCISLTEDLSSIGQELTNTQDAMRGLECTVQEERLEFEELQAAHRELVVEHHNMGTVKGCMEEETEQMKEEKQRMVVVLEESQIEVAALKASVVMFEGRVAEVSESLTVCEKNLSEERLECERIRTMHQKATISKENASKQSAHQEDLITTLETNLGEITAEHFCLSQENTEVKNRILQLQTQYDSDMTDAHSLLQTVEASKEALQAEHTELCKSYEDVVGKLEANEHSLSVLSKLYEATHQTNISLKEQHEETESWIQERGESFRHEISDLNAELQCKASETDALRKQHDMASDIQQACSSRGDLLEKELRDATLAHSLLSLGNEEHAQRAHLMENCLTSCRFDFLAFQRKVLTHYASAHSVLRKAKESLSEYSASLHHLHSENHGLAVASSMLESGLVAAHHNSDLLGKELLQEQETRSRAKLEFVCLEELRALAVPPHPQSREGSVESTASCYECPDEVNVLVSELKALLMDKDSRLMKLSLEKSHNEDTLRNQIDSLEATLRQQKREEKKQPDTDLHRFSVELNKLFVEVKNHPDFAHLEVQAEMLHIEAKSLVQESQILQLLEAELTSEEAPLMKLVSPKKMAKFLSSSKGIENYMEIVSEVNPKVKLLQNENPSSPTPPPFSHPDMASVTQRVKEMEEEHLAALSELHAQRDDLQASKVEVVVQMNSLKETIHDKDPRVSGKELDSLRKELASTGRRCKALEVKHLEAEAKKERALLSCMRMEELETSTTSLLANNRALQIALDHSTGEERRLKGRVAELTERRSHLQQKYDKLFDQLEEKDLHSRELLSEVKTQLETEVTRQRKEVVVLAKSLKTQE